MVSNINSLQKSSPNNNDLENKLRTFPLFAAVGNLNKRVFKNNISHLKKNRRNYKHTYLKRGTSENFQTRNKRLSLNPSCVSLDVTFSNMTVCTRGLSLSHNK